MRRYFTVVGSSLLSMTMVVGKAQAAPLEWGVVPDKAAIVLHADFDAGRASDLGKRVLQDVLPAFGVLKAFGIDAERDMSSLTAIASADKPDKGVLCVKIAASIDTLWEHLKTEPHAKMMNVGGHEILSWDDKGVRKYGVVKHVDGSTAENQRRMVFVCDEWEWLSEVLISAGKRSTQIDNPDKHEKRGEGRPTPSSDSVVFAWLREIPSDLRTPKDFGQAALFGSLTSAKLDISGVADKVNASADLTYEDVATAAEMRTVLEGLSSMLRLASKKMPEYAPLANGLNAIKPTVQGETLQLKGAWSADSAGELITAVSAVITKGKD